MFKHAAFNIGQMKKLKKLWFVLYFPSFSFFILFFLYFLFVKKEGGEETWKARENSKLEKNSSFVLPYIL